MIKLVIKWIIFALVIMGTCYLPGIEVENFAFAMLIAAILTIFNVIVKPILKIVTFPISLLTFGLFNTIINIAILFVISYFIPQYHITNIISGIEAALIIAVAFCIIRKV